MQHAERSLA